MILKNRMQINCKRFLKYPKVQCPLQRKGPLINYFDKHGGGN